MNTSLAGCEVPRGGPYKARDVGILPLIVWEHRSAKSLKAKLLADQRKPARDAARAERRRQKRLEKYRRHQAKACRNVPGIEFLALDPCAYCGAPNPTTHDHIEPISRGGEHSLDNLVRACWDCNKEKTTQPLLLFLARRAQRRAA